MAQRRCCVSGCSNSGNERASAAISITGEEEFNYFPFPTADYDQLVKWMWAVVNPGCSLVCSRHFRDSDYVAINKGTSSGCPTLNADAVPMLNLPQEDALLSSVQTAFPESAFPEFAIPQHNDGPQKISEEVHQDKPLLSALDENNDQVLDEATDKYAGDHTYQFANEAPALPLHSQDESESSRQEPEERHVVVYVKNPDRMTREDDFNRKEDRLGRMEVKEELGDGQSRSGRKKYRCRVCDNFFVTRQEVASHLRMHLKRRHTHRARGDVLLKECEDELVLEKHKRVRTKKIKRNDEMYECEMCGELFKQRWSLVMHCKMHNRQTNVCGTCGRVFAYNSELTKHQRDHLTDTSNVQKVDLMSLLNLSCVNLESDEHTVASGVSSSPHVTQVTEASVLSSDEMTHLKDLAVVSSDFKTEQLACDELSSVTLLDSSITLTERKSFEKPQVPSGSKSCVLKMFSSRPAQRKASSAAQTWGKELFKCDVCNKKFFQSAYLEKHLKQHTLPFGCNVCGKEFALETEYIAHQKLSQFKQCKQEEPILCGVCGKTFKHKAWLTTHMTSHSGEKPHMCETCGKQFVWNASYAKHKKICSKSGQPSHAIEKLCKCDICGKAFRDNWSLEVHFRTHTGEKPYVCDTCGKALSHKRSLIKHQRIHAGEKPYVCETCGKHFHMLASLNSHRTIHTREWKYKCNICDKVFRTSGTLMKHHRTHIGLEKPYFCSICDRKFKNRSSLITHHNKMHTGI